MDHDTEETEVHLDNINFNLGGKLHIQPLASSTKRRCKSESCPSAADVSNNRSPPPDRVRRTKIFENCFGSASILNNSLDCTMVEERENKVPLSTETALSRLGDPAGSEEEALFGMVERSNLFSYPTKPIEKREFEQFEVELTQRVQRKRSTCLSLQSEECAFDRCQRITEAEVPPFYDRIYVHGDDSLEVVAGVSNFPWYFTF